MFVRLARIFILLAASVPSLAQENAVYAAVQRIKAIYKLSDEAYKQRVWASFGSKQYNVPLIYYSGNITFIANPNQSFLNQFQPIQVYKKKHLVIFQLDRRLDDSPLHMETSMSIEDSTAFDYYFPYIRCSSREEFESVTKFPTDVETWTAMTLHECFHGYQTFHKDYVNLGFENKFIYPQVGEQVGEFYTVPWFRDAIDQENDLLLDAIDASNMLAVDSLIGEFFEVREKRRARTIGEVKADIALLEKSFETHEGTARFIEAYAQQHLVKQKKGEPFQLSPSLYDTRSTQRYYYATGFNITRLLKKLGLDYTKLFMQPALTLEDILKGRN